MIMVLTGPRWFPVVGNYPLLRRELRHLYYHHLVWSGLAARYGPVVGLRLGRDRIVIVSGYQAIRTVLTHEEFEGRPDGFFFQLRTFGQRLGVVFTDGALWQQQRKFSLKHLRNLGLGKSTMESQIRSEAVELVASLRRKSEGGSVPIFMHDAFDICVLNSLWAMLAGERFSLEDSRLAELLDIVHESFRMLDMSGGLLNQMPFLRFLAPDRCGYRRLVHVLQRLWHFLRETVAEHRASLSLDHSRDLIDSFLQEMEQMKSRPSSTFTEEQLLSLCLDLFMAGSETTSNTLGFASLYMILYPHVQLRVQQEMDAVIGRGHQPTLHDRPRLCYVEAVLMEVQRHGNIVPVAVAHRAMNAADLMGYTIPKVPPSLQMAILT
ncbi:hypothetical protein PR048_031065 [Dryococelus australis]|uniref:Cytochrome P450 n=1 Tax=Dryococelus australis TaxID=614101 RepID=A0ABQ9G720_9NEOP|nr:hypothetical protein PR048_031065 [Dryococelus australis]